MYRHENRAFDDVIIGDMKHDFNSSTEQMVWNFEDQDPNRKVLMSLQYALENCANMKTVQFHMELVVLPMLYFSMFTWT